MDRPWKPILLSLIVLLAGCLGSGDDGDPVSTSDPSPTDDATKGSPGGNDNGTSGTPPAQNAPPTAHVNASVVLGAAPLNVTFTLDGSDADGDDLAWEFDADGDGDAAHDGTTLPANVNVTYETPGVYNATLAVSDGGSIVYDTVVINVTSPATGGSVLYLVGDGSTTVVTDPTTAQAETGQPFVTNKGLSTAGNGGERSAFVVAPSGNPASSTNYLLPSFVGNEAVMLSGQPVTLTVYVNQLCPPNAAGDEFPLHALLLTADGDAISPLAVAYGAPGASVSEVVFTLEPDAGAYVGLQVQYGKSATSDPPSPCTAFVTEWGADDVNARLELAPGDVVFPAA